MNPIFFRSTVLRFMPHMKLATAAKLAHRCGYELVVKWVNGRCVVTPVEPVGKQINAPRILHMQAGEH